MPQNYTGEDRSEAAEATLYLHAERIAVARHPRRTLVRATRTTRTRDIVVDEALREDAVVVERVAIGRVVQAVPPVRTLGDVTIVPVVEEEVIVQRRLVLREEVHLRRVQTTRRHIETIPLREQAVDVTRTPLAD